MEIGSPQWEQLILEGARAFDVALDRSALDRMGVHASELLKWNRRTNLTAITDPTGLAVKHILDSLSPAALLPANARLLDIGSGAGFPGLPLKIALPAMTVTLVDGSRKKVSFLKHIIRLLQLDFAEAVQIRAEQMPVQTRFRGAFDVIVCRAVSSVGEFVELALPLLRPAGWMMAYRGARGIPHCRPDTPLSAAELDPALAGQSGLSVEIKPYRLPLYDHFRHVVVLRREPQE
jgi:16S rRNA (guanine527-N7)-methyltransferase